MKRRLRWFIRPLLVKVSWWLTTHDGFYSPCDDDHCCDVREKARKG
jgi:hypothetical protein